LTDGRSDRAAQDEPYAFGARIALQYSAFFFFIGVWLPYFPLWLQGNGLDARQIAAVVAVAQLVRVATAGPVAAYGDRAGDRANVVVFLAFASAVCVSFYPFATGFVSIFLITIALAVFQQPLVPVLESLALSGVRRFGADYGRIRLWGSLVFIIANLGGGWLLADTQVGAIMVMLVASAFASAALALLLPRIGKPRLAADPLILANMTALKLLANRRFMSVMIACGLIQASHALLYSFGTIYWVSAGYSGATIGAFWALGVGAEVVLFRYSRLLRRRISPIAFVVAGGLAATIRWCIMPLEPSGGLMVPLQLLHGLSFGAVHLGFMFYIAETFPEERLGAAQAVEFTIAGAVMAAASFFSGPLYASFGVEGFWAMGAIAALATLLVATLPRYQPHNSALSGETVDVE
jgi:MFS transporter, PPP family, 3-phenylpropionic acid transporter